MQKLIGRSRPRSRDGDEDEWEGTDAAEVGYGEPSDRDHRAAPEPSARPRPALDLELSLLDDHDGVGRENQLQVELEPGRHSKDPLGEALRERIAKERIGGALVRGHFNVSGRPKAGKSSG